MFNLDKFKKIDNVLKFKIETWIITGLIILILTTFIFVFSKIIFFKIDLTNGNKFSISKVSRDLIKKIDGKIVIRYYYNDNCVKHVEMNKVVQFVKDSLKDYERNSKGMIEVIIDELSISNDKDKEMIDNLVKSGFSYTTLDASDNEGEARFAKILSGLTIDYEGKNPSVVGNIFSDIGFEYVLNKEIMKILDINSVVTGIFVGSQYKSADNEYIYIKRIFETEFKSVKVLYSDESIPEDVNVIMLIGIEKMTEFDLFQIDQFLMRGGSLIIASSGINVAFTNQMQMAFPKDSIFFEMLKHYGITINKNLIGDNESYQPVNFNKTSRYPIWPVVLTENINSKSPIVKFIKQFNLFWASSIDIDEKIKNNTEVLLKTTKKAWEQNDQMQLNPEMYTYQIQEGNKQFILSCAFNGPLDSYFKDKAIPQSNTPGMTFDKVKKDSGEARIVVISNEVFLEKGIIESRLVGQNEIFFLINAIDWLSNDISLIAVRNKGKFDMPLSKVSRVNKKQFEIRRNLIIFISIFVIPVLIIILAVVLNTLKYYQRKKLNYEALKK